MRRVAGFLLAGMVGMTVLAGCGDDGGEATDLAVTITEAGDRVNIGMPANIDGGVVNLTLTNSGQGPHSLQFIKVEGDHTIEEWREFLDTEETVPVPDWISEGGGIGTVNPGQTGTSSFELTEGRHFAWDDESDQNDVPNTAKGGILEVTVSGEGGGELPEAEATVTADEYKFTTEGLTAGSTSVRFENDGDELHHFIAAPIAPGSDLDDVRAFFETEGPPTGPPPLDFEAGVGVPVMDSGGAVVADLTFEAGEYAFVCFITDRAGGPPHFTQGMLQSVTVAAA
jgi:hypothetical protein